MSKLKVDIIDVNQQTIYGLWKDSNDKSISADINMLSEQYHSIITLPKEVVLPYFVLSKDYDQQSGDFKMFIGSTIKNDDLERFIIEAGEYARITIKPKLSFLWGIAIGEAKRYFYAEWLPKSKYKARNMEYEFHTENSIGKHPTVDIIFAINS